jgi:hypothetical protein
MQLCTKIRDLDFYDLLVHFYTTIDKYSTLEILHFRIES